jgi:phenylacetate-coenzyme A ligase PaaK-like adenylate-forming protein
MLNENTSDSDFEELRSQHLEEVRAYTAEAVKRLSWTREQVQEEQTRRLRTVMAHAQQSSPFYADRLGHVEASTFEVRDLVKIPPLTKNEVMENWDRLVTDPRLRLDDVTAHLERLHSGSDPNAYYLGNYYAAATGGTSGQRGLFLWDWETFIVIANLAYRMEAQKDLLEPPPHPRRTAVICAGSYVHASRFAFPAMLDPEREGRVFPAGLTIDRMVEQLNAYQPDRIVGYASIVQELCAQALDGRLQIRPRRISTNSEPLFPEAREMAKEAWGINIHNSWGSVEIGMGATEGDAFQGATLAEDFLIFEPVDDHDQPVEDFAQADRLLVTKLYGHVMPIIRYEMTDTVIIDQGENPDAPGYSRIKEIKGRADIWFVYNDNVKIHPMVFRGVLGQDRHISEYQVQQTPEGARVLAITHGEFSSAELERSLIQSLKNAGLPNPRISIQPVSELPRHPQTNKLKRFIPLTD